MIACGSSNGNVYLVEVSENMTYSAKNDKAILTAVSILYLLVGNKLQPAHDYLFKMLDRESKREKILEGKLREIKIKMKTQVKTQEEPHEARISDLLLLQTEKPMDDNKDDDEPVVKESVTQGTVACFYVFS